MPLSPGEVVRARVRQVAVFGLFLDYRGQDILVLLPETSWIASYASCTQIADVGDEFDVRILQWVADRNQYAGSIRAAHPESDPWSGRRPLRVGEIIRARVVRSVKRADRCGNRLGYLLELRPAAYVMVCGEASGPLAVGTELDVTVTAVDPSQHQVCVAVKK